MIYIYALICPESEVVRYIGKTKNIKNRLTAHLSKAKGCHLDHHCARWIRALLDRGLTPSIVVLSEIQDGEDWQSAEMATIAAYRAMGHDLTNSTAGGEGFHDMPMEIRMKAAATWRKTMSDPQRMAKFIQAMNELRNRPEVRKKQSDARKARWQDPEMKAAMLESMRTPEAVARRSAATTKRYSDPEALAKHSAKMKDIWNTPERSEEARQRSFNAWADPEITARRVSSIKAAYSTPEMKARCSDINREIGSRPEVKAVKSKKTAQSWSDPIMGAKRRAALSNPETRAKMSAAAKARFAKPGAKAYLSTPEARARLSVSATLREEKKRRQK